MIYPNLFAVWIAPSTLYHKSTALNKARYVLRETVPFLLAPQEATPEALYSDMSGKQPTNYNELPAEEQTQWLLERDFAAQRGLVTDEISGYLASAGKDYNAGLLESLMLFYDCEPKFTRSTVKNGRLTINNAYLSILGASTPAALRSYLTPEKAWGNGSWPRFAILTPDTARPPWREPRSG